MNIIYVKQIIERAIKENKHLLIDYVSKDMTITSDRIIEPRELHTPIDKPWSVMAHCYLRNDVRQFQLDGIQKIKFMDQSDYGKGVKSK